MKETKHSDIKICIKNNGCRLKHTICSYLKDLLIYAKNKLYAIFKNNLKCTIWYKRAQATVHTGQLEGEHQ